jgi:hypothetical protein
MQAGNMQGIRPAEFMAAARIHAMDVIAATILLFCASIMAGRIWRFPFDDELFALAATERSSALDLLGFYLNGYGLHPPLSFLFFYAVHHLGFGEATMRLCSFAMMATALVLFQLLTLTLVGRRTGAAARPFTRLTAVLLFGLSPLAIGQGDAIRWYPMFALFFALFSVWYLIAGERRSRLLSAIPLGLAASTNFLAAAVIVPFLLYRHALERRFRPFFEVAYWLLFSVFGGLGIVTAFFVLSTRFGPSAAVEFGNGSFRAVGTEMLGFFGGNALGIGDGWIIVPVVLVAAAAFFCEIDRKQTANPVHLLLLMFGAMALISVSGFGKSRSFLYLAPALAAILTLFVDRQSTERNARWIALLVALIAAPSVGAVAAINHGTRPFKRNAAIPYEQVLDFIRTNGQGDTLVMSSDPIVVWALDHKGVRSDRCVSYFLRKQECFLPGRHFDTLFIIMGQSNRSRDKPFMRQVAAKIAEITGDRRQIAQLHAGLDQDAALKGQLTGMSLDEFILSVELYR